jgi:hypothetical protein
MAAIIRVTRWIGEFSAGVVANAGGGDPLLILTGDESGNLLLWGDTGGDLLLWGDAV